MTNVRLPYLYAAIAFLTMVACDQSTGLNSDENISVCYANMPFREMLKASVYDNNPPLFYSLLWVWIRLACSSSDAVAQLLPNTLSALTLLVAVRTAKVLKLRPLYQCLVATLVVFNPAFSGVSSVVRTYSLTIFLVSCSVFFLLRYVEDQDKWSARNMFGCTALLLYSHITAYFYIVACYVSIFALSKAGLFRRRQILLLLSMHFLIAAPWLMVVVDRTRAIQHQQDWTLIAPGLSGILYYYAGWTDVGLVAWLGTFMLSVFAVGQHCLTGRSTFSRTKLTCLLIMHIVPGIIAACISYSIVPVWGMPYLAASIVPWALVLGLAAQEIGECFDALGLTFGASVVTKSLLSLLILAPNCRAWAYQVIWPVEGQPDWPKVNKVLAKCCAKGEPIYICFSWYMAAVERYGMLPGISCPSLREWQTVFSDARSTGGNNAFASVRWLVVQECKFPPCPAVLAFARSRRPFIHVIEVGNVKIIRIGR